MKTIDHSQTQRYLLAAADHLLGEPEQEALAHHLRDCAECRAQARQLSQLETDLQQAFHSRWDDAPPPSRPLVTEFPAAQGWGARLTSIGVNIGLALLWLWLYRAVFPYLRVIFTHEEFRTNQIVLLAVLALIAGQLRTARLRPRLNMLPRAYWPGLALALGGSALYLVAERFLDINTLSATLFGLATYGLLGLWLSPRRWIEGLPAALLLIGALPFGEHLETFVGYPLRLLTARLVSDGLAALGVPAVNVDTILVLESGFSQVDSPCSGIKSLWTGALFLLAATWLERHPINLRWIGATILVSGLLLAANVARVGVLVLVGEVAGWRVAAEMLHVPLGVLGFVAVCGLALTLLKLGQRAGIPGWPKPPRPLEGAEWGDRKGLPRPVWFIPALGLTVFIMGLLYAPRPEIAQARAAFTWSFPADLNIEASPLSPPLFEWATEGGADAAERWRFETGDLRGSMLFLTSHTWRGQHRPERCFEVEGLTVDASQTYLVAPDFPVRYLTLKNGPLRFSAAYWLQTTGRVTEDYATRIWADLAPQRQPWVLVTVLFDDQPPPEFPAVQALFQALRGVVAQGLNGGLP